MRSEHKKITNEDKFARTFYCRHARLDYVRYVKKSNSKKFRKIAKEFCRNV